MKLSRGPTLGAALWSLVVLQSVPIALSVGPASSCADQNACIEFEVDRATDENKCKVRPCPVQVCLLFNLKACKRVSIDWACDNADADQCPRKAEPWNRASTRGKSVDDLKVVGNCGGKKASDDVCFRVVDQVRMCQVGKPGEILYWTIKDGNLALNGHDGANKFTRDLKVRMENGEIEDIKLVASCDNAPAVNKCCADPSCNDNVSKLERSWQVKVPDLCPKLKPPHPPPPPPSPPHPPPSRPPPSPTRFPKKAPAIPRRPAVRPIVPRRPAVRPIVKPIRFPTKAPAIPRRPAVRPIVKPIRFPTKAPAIPRRPTARPIVPPIRFPTEAPASPRHPTTSPVAPPTGFPTRAPASPPQPTVSPVAPPTGFPTQAPASPPQPTVSPISSPTRFPTGAPASPRDPTTSPVSPPTRSPTQAPASPPHPTVSPVFSPTRFPTGAPAIPPPTPPPTGSPVFPPTPPPTEAPLQVGQTETFVSAAKLVPSATRVPAKPLTKNPSSPDCQIASGTVRFDLWNGDTNKPTVVNLKSGGSYCLAGNWNVRAKVRHESSSCGPVKMSLATKAGRVRHTKHEAKPPFFLFGDDSASGDVYGARAVKPGLQLLEGATYCLKATDPRSKAVAEVCLVQHCGGST